MGDNDAQRASERCPVVRSRVASGSVADRRAWCLWVGMPQLLTTSQAAAADAIVRASGGRAKSCIVLFLMGGPPQHSTWDPKPESPEEVRGEIGPIATKVPGVQFGELMPRLADARRQAGRAAGGLDGRQRPFVERLLHDDRPAARSR